MYAFINVVIVSLDACDFCIWILGENDNQFPTFLFMHIAVKTAHSSTVYSFRIAVFSSEDLFIHISNPVLKIHS